MSKNIKTGNSPEGINPGITPQKTDSKKQVSDNVPNSTDCGNNFKKSDTDCHPKNNDPGTSSNNHSSDFAPRGKDSNHSDNGSSSKSKDTHKSDTSPHSENSNSGTSGSIGFCVGKASGLYPVSGNKNAYWNCWNGITYKQNCPDGLVFDQTCQCCNNVPITPDSSKINDNKAFCTGKANGLYPVEGNNNAYWNCWNGITYKQNCPVSLFFVQHCQCCE
ncbi:chondroitin proteoglycan 2-like [Xenopus laevis]|uniref:chitinase n=1 Tax=Xenopus laevis TaxID=8355 RepID=A0A8J1MGJ7_XENLA|nr:chondroitin proteoglycan 2-like [Xenopus laevis]